MSSIRINVEISSAKSFVRCNVEIPVEILDVHNADAAYLTSATVEAVVGSVEGRMNQQLSNEIEHAVRSKIAVAREKVLTRKHSDQQEALRGEHEHRLITPTNVVTLFVRDNDIKLHTVYVDASKPLKEYLLGWLIARSYPENTRFQRRGGQPLDINKTALESELSDEAGIRMIVGSKGCTKCNCGLHK